MTRPYHIQMISNRYLPVIGGAEMQIAQLCAELARRGHRVRMLTRRLTPDLAECETLAGIPIERLSPVGLSSRATLLIVPQIFGHLLRQRRQIDVIHVNTLGALGLISIAAAKLSGRPIVLKVPGRGGLIREDAVGIQPSAYSRWVRRFVIPPAAWRWLLLRADAIIAISQEIYDEAAQIGVQRVMVRIPNGVDTGRFHPAADADERRRWRERLGLPLTGRLIFSSGRLVWGKRFDVLLAALPGVVARHPDVQVVIAGSGRLQADDVSEELRAQVERLGLTERVRFIGNVSQVEEYYRAADVFAFPSEREGLPNVVLEAMASGVPVIACRIGGVVDLLEDGVTGWLVAPGEVAPFEGALLAALDDPDEAGRRSAAASARIQAHFSLEAVAAQYEALYARVIEG